MTAASQQRLVGFLLAGWVPFLAALALVYMTIPPSPDQSQFDWMAYIATQGRPFYVGSFDMNWPGAMWLHEAGLRLLGMHAWTWRLTDFVLMTGFAAAGAVFLWRSGWRVAPLVFLFLYPPLYVTAGGWMAGQRDIVATGFLIVACALAVPGGRRERLAMAGAGLAVAAAVLVRPTFLSFAAGLVLLEALPLSTLRARIRGRTTRAACMLAGLAAGIGAAVAVGLHLGSLDDWHEQSLEFALSIYAGEWPQRWQTTLHTLFVRSWNWICLLGAIGLVVWFRRDRASNSLVLLFGVAATSIVSFFVQAKGFGYHLGGLLPVLVLLAAVAFDGADGLRRRASSARARAASLALLVPMALLAVAGTASKLENFLPNMRLVLSGELEATEGYGLTEAERRRIVALIREGSAANDTVAIYGTNYELPYRARRLPAYRYFTPAADQITPNFPHAAEWLAEVDAGLAVIPPKFMILDRRFVEGSGPSFRALDPDKPILDRFLDHLDSGYAIAFENAALLVFQKVE